MADKDSFKTGVVTLQYPKILTPDTYGDQADGRYKTRWTMEATASKKLQEFLKKKAAAAFPDKKGIKYPWKTDEETGEVSFTAGSKYQPLTVDAKNKKVPSALKIGGGTKANLAIGLNPFKDKMGAARLSLYLNAVQIIELVEWQSKAQESPFEASEGFEADDAATESTFGDTPTATDSTSTSEDLDDGVPF